MKIGTYAVPFLLIGFFDSGEKIKGRNILADLRFVGILMLIAYIIHQFEEHWIDIYGNRFAFYTFNNNFILTNLGEPDSLIKPLTVEAIFVINTALVWLVGLLAIWRAPKTVFPLMAMNGIIVINGIVHIVASVATGAYNPGLATSIFIFLPFYFITTRYFLKKSVASKKQVIGSIIWSVLGHVIMVAGLLAANWFNLVPEMGYFALLVIWSLIPSVISLK
ncbi:MAG: HXXEE domain-containing protein [Bacteroidota bacterium]